MDPDGKLLRIGTFSTLSRISVRMLRHYQEHGVLMPAEVDPFSGYRFYRPEQLIAANLAVQLRDAGFPVARIAQLVASEDPAKVEAAIEEQRAELSRLRTDLHAQLRALDRVSTTLRGRPDMTEVSTTQLPPMELAAIRRIIPSYSDEGLLWQEIMGLLQQSGAAFPAGGISGATFHDPDYREADVDVEIWIQVSAPFAAVPPLQHRSEPAREVVTATLRGDYSQIGEVTAAVGAYLAEHDLQTGQMFNIYRVSPAQNPDPSSWVTDVCFPVMG